MPLTDSEKNGLWLGRAWRPGIGPCLVTLRDGALVDITRRDAPTVRDVLELDDPALYVSAAAGDRIGPLEEVAANPVTDDHVHLLAPCDLQAIKAAGVTFAKSMVERVIEERAAGDPAKAEGIRRTVQGIIGDRLDTLVPGSDKAMAVKAELIRQDLWSQYLEVGIGKDAEVFTKTQPMAAVGTGAQIGLHPESHWNNPEPEVVLAVDSQGRIHGATLGNDVNLRDFEGRSALLLSKAKDNNASCAIGPMIRLFDDTYGMDDMLAAELDLKVEGTDGYVLHGASSMKEISRSPADLVAATLGRHHQYPDGFVLFLGTLFAPTEDRSEPGQGFTHEVGDVVTIACPGLGTLRNTVRRSTECPEWTFGTAALMRNLAGRNLL